MGTKQFVERVTGQRIEHEKPSQHPPHHDLTGDDGSHRKAGRTSEDAPSWGCAGSSPVGVDSQGGRMNGKGSGRRPSAISKREADENWERTFGGDGNLTVKGSINGNADENTVKGSPAPTEH